MEALRRHDEEGFREEICLEIAACVAGQRTRENKDEREDLIGNVRKILR